MSIRTQLIKSLNALPNSLRKDSSLKPHKPNWYIYNIVEVDMYDLY